MTQFTYELDEIGKAASAVIEAASDEKVWVFQGDMGAGKTTLIKALSKSYSILDQVSSPTFGIVNHYENQAGEIFYHFDFYRMDDATEAFLPEKFFLIRIINESDTKRTLNFQHIQDAS